MGGELNIARWIFHAVAEVTAFHCYRPTSSGRIVGIRTTSMKSSAESKKFFPAHSSQPVEAPYWGEYLKLMLHTAYRWLGNQEDAEDAVLDVYLDFYKKFVLMGKVRPDTVGGLLCKMVTGECIDILRQRRVKILSLEDVVPGTDGITYGEIEVLPIYGSEVSNDPAQIVERDVLARVMKDCLDKLGPKHRQVLWKSEVEGLSDAEIADDLDEPRGTVKSRLHYAKKKMRKCIEEHQGSET